VDASDREQATLLVAENPSLETELSQIEADWVF
jgi:hypothetical protein